MNKTICVTKTEEEEIFINPFQKILTVIKSGANTLDELFALGEYLDAVDAGVYADTLGLYDKANQQALLSVLRLGSNSELSKMCLRSSALKDIFENSLQGRHLNTFAAHALH